MKSDTEYLEQNNGYLIEHIKYISFGYRCTSAGLLRRLGLREESHPFDWMVSRLPVIRDCIETGFRHFLLSSHYEKSATVTGSYSAESGEKDLIVCEENVWHNTHYTNMGCLDPIHMSKYWTVGTDTYAYPMAFNHHDMTLPETHQYFQRCIDRFRNALDSQYCELRFLYVHPIQDMCEHEDNCDDLIREFAEFFRYIQTKRHPCSKTRGIFVLPVRTNYPYPITNTYANPVEILHHDASGYDIVRIYCNRDIVDAGEIWFRNGYIEEDKLLHTLKYIFDKSGRKDPVVFETPDQPERDGL